MRHFDGIEAGWLVLLLLLLLHTAMAIQPDDGVLISQQYSNHTKNVNNQHRTIVDAYYHPHPTKSNRCFVFTSRCYFSGIFRFCWWQASPSFAYMNVFIYSNIQIPMTHSGRLHRSHIFMYFSKWNSLGWWLISMLGVYAVCVCSATCDSKNVDLSTIIL